MCHLSCNKHSDTRKNSMFNYSDIIGVYVFYKRNLPFDQGVIEPAIVVKAMPDEAMGCTVLTKTGVETIRIEWLTCLT